MALNMDKGALSGIKVIDFSMWLPGQYCGMVLADFGADVVKVEAPGGDPNRNFRPQLAPGMSSWNLALNRNKRGITVNLKTEEGREIIRRLAKEADVFIEGFRPGFMDKMGLGKDELLELNPRLIYCSISGFGHTSSYKRTPAHDLNVIGLAGLDFNDADGDISVSEVQVSALGSSLNAVAAISMALFSRERTGKGQYIDINLFATAMGLQIVSSAAIWGCRVTGDTPFGRSSHYYNVYKTKDNAYLTVGTIEPKFWQHFCDVAELPELKERQFDFAHAKELTEIVANKIAEKTQKEWMELVGALDFCVTPVHKLEDVLDGDMVKEADITEKRREDIGEINYLKPAMQLSGTPGTIRFRAPYAGEHNEEVLKNLGYDASTIEEFKEKGVI